MKLNKNKTINTSFSIILLNICLFIERLEGKKKEKERNINVWLPLMHPPPTGDPARNPSRYPDWELNW